MQRRATGAMVDVQVCVTCGCGPEGAGHVGAP